MENRNSFNNTKILAFYLPQYHRIPENDEWWGEGFTEWTNVKKAEPLFEGHIQPRIPYNHNYYDLADGTYLNHQMKMAKKYGIDGFCIYHYWFQGKKLLEKPLEYLLENNKEKFPFCICWANEPWTRTWDGDEGAKQVLIHQNYGDKKEWEEHFLYLNKFFQKDEYIFLDGKPVIVIYKPDEIFKYDEMIDFWNFLAVKAGYQGIYVLNVKRYIDDIYNKVKGDGIIDFEPFMTYTYFNSNERNQIQRVQIGNRKENKGREYRIFDYEKFLRKMTERYILKYSEHNLGFFVGWDNTPRKGIETDFIFENVEPQIFKKYFNIQYQKSMECNNKFLFINAWNEWGESTYLEPDEQHGFAFLEAIKAVKENYL